MKLQTFFPLVWDSTQLAEAKTCQTSFFRRHIQHLNGEESTDLIAGAAFAAGIHATRQAFYSEGKHPDEALYAGITALYKEYGGHYPQFKESKSRERMALALESYFNEYDMRYDDFKPIKLEDGSHAMEYNLLVEIKDLAGNPILHPDLGLPLLFNGRLDMLAEHAGEFWLVDEKTTGSYFSDTWPTTWNMRDQFTAYCYLAQNSGIPELQYLSKVMVRGISLPASRSKDPETRDKYHADISNIKHMIAPCIRNEFMVANWHWGMIETLQQLVAKYEAFKKDGDMHKHFMKNGGSHCTAYGRNCYFSDSCINEKDEKYLEVEEQFIWRPDLAARQPLQEFLKDLDSMKVAD